MKKLLLIIFSILFLSGCGAATDTGLSPETDTAETESVYAIPDVLTVDGDVTLPLDPTAYEDSFNKILLSYTADGPLQCVFRYTVGEEAVEDLFYLEEGTWDFAGLIASYDEGGTGSALSEVTFTPLDGTASLEIATVGVTTVPALDRGDSVQFIENERFRLGADLRWGGAICHVEDLTCPIDRVSNLVNKSDAGRLIQQSWYGTKDQPRYDNAIYDGIPFSYNPVQGGDQYTNRSRLIDLKVTEDSIYIKTQAMDWALDGQITASYMENTYTLQEDVIRVDNRFVDFTGWDHPEAGQELPAVYTISYLDTFVWYDGASPWTGDTLTTHSELKFRSEQPTFPIRYSNTETWCAFINASEDWGLGLYVPGVNKWNAQRFQYDGSRDPRSFSCSYVAPTNNIRLYSFVPQEYSYLLTTGSTAEIRNTFTAHKDFTDNALLVKNSAATRCPDGPVDMTSLDFTDPTLQPILTAPLNTALSHDAEEGVLRMDVTTGYDVQATLDFSMSTTALTAEDFSKIVVEYMIPATNGRFDYGCEFFLCTGDSLYPEGGKSVRGEYICDGQYHTLEIPLTGLDFWSGKINAIRYDYFNESMDGDVFYLKSIRLEP
ncbi:MAG: hypothetical protein IKV57_10465 [Clostridia bacterium]|nr:hypothetical protein [Clostridia bacterium]